MDSKCSECLVVTPSSRNLTCIENSRDGKEVARVVLEYERHAARFTTTMRASSLCALTALKYSAFVVRWLQVP